MSAPLGRRIVLAGLIAGTVDIGAAALISHRNLPWICQAIATGLLGPASFRQGHRSELVGLGCQWFIGITVAALYVLATTPLRSLRRNWGLGGTIAGVVTFVVMNYVVMPLSALHRANRFTALTFVENLVAIIVFGLIIAAIVREKDSRG